MKSKKILNMTLIALMAAIIAVCSWITVGIGPVPFTLQTFGIFLALRFLGGKKGTAAIGIYMLLGAVGLPVFSGFRGGFGHILCPTGGYILGFLLSGIVVMIFEKINKKSVVLRIICDALSLIACYALGTVWFYFTLGVSKGMSIMAVLSACVIPFIIPDLIKILLAELICIKTPKSIKEKT